MATNFYYFAKKVDRIANSVEQKQVLKGMIAELKAKKGIIDDLYRPLGQENIYMNWREGDTHMKELHCLIINANGDTILRL